MTSTHSFSPLAFRSSYDLVVHMYRRNPVEARLFLSATAVSMGLGLLGSYLFATLLTTATGTATTTPTAPTTQTAPTIATDTANTIDFLIALYLWHKALDWLCEMPAYLMQHRAVKQIAQDFERSCLDWYANHVSLESRERIDATKFHTQVLDM